MRRVLIGMAILTLTACGWIGGTHSKKSVAEAIEAHLKQNSRLNFGNFSTTVEDVKFSGSTAQARVKFQSTDGRNLSVEVGYGLRLEDGKWQVVSSSPLSGQGMSGQNPHDQPPPPSGAEPAIPAPEPSH